MSSTATLKEPQQALDSQPEAQPLPQKGNFQPSLLHVLMAMAWLGLVTGLVEMGIVLGKGLFRGHFLKINPYFVWMTPLAETLVYLALGLLLFGLTVFFSRRSFLCVISGFLSFLGAYCIAGTVGGLATWAMLLLSLGMAVQLARLVEKQPERFLNLVHRTFFWFAGAVAICALVMTGYRSYGEYAAFQELPSPPEKAPNVLFVVLDTVRADALSLYSKEAVETPHLDQLGKQGVVFDRAISPASWTFPSHASMFTGIYPNWLSADWNTPLSETNPTLAECLSRQGYLTGGFVGNNFFCSRPTGLDRGFVSYKDFPLSLRQLFSHSQLLNLFHGTYRGLSFLGIYDHLHRKKGKQVSNEFLNWLDEHRKEKDRPFFAFLNYLDAHDPYLPQKLVDEDRKLTHEEKLMMKSWAFVVPSQVSDEQYKLARSCYDSMVHELDRQMGRLFSELESRGLRENTIIIITSDHGELFGEHGCCIHGNNLYRPVVHVPLIVSWPGRIPQNERISVPVTLRDIAATILDLTGMSKKEKLPGHSLRVTWDPTKDSQERKISVPYANSTEHPYLEVREFMTQSPLADGELHALLQDGDYLIREGDGDHHLYDFMNDPQEQNDLADQPEQTPRLQKAGQALDKFLNRPKERK